MTGADQSPQVTADSTVDSALSGVVAIRHTLPQGSETAEQFTAGTIPVAFSQDR
jgi:hypothetical protein